MKWLPPSCSIGWFIELNRCEWMSNSFLLHSASCDKQMTVPHSTQLYCSDTCRKMDTLPVSSRFPTPASFSTPLNAQQSYTTICDTLGFPPESRVPFVISRSTHAVDARIPPVDHDGKADIDPTEWKPAEAGGADGDHVSRVESEKKGARIMPSLSSTATASSVSSENPSPTSTPYLLTSSGPDINSHTASITDATSLGIEDLKLCAKGVSVYEKRILSYGKRSDATGGSLKQLLEQGKRD